MSIGFDNPGLLPLSALIGLPILLHLIARPRPRLLKFPSLMLLEKAHRDSVNLRRPRHWILLILRTLWVALLLGVFLQPRWFNRPKTESISGTKNVVILLDATASLRAREGSQSRYARAVNEAVTLLQQLKTGDRANIIRVRAVPESFYTEPGVNRDYLIEQLRMRPCSEESGSIADALRVAGEQLARVQGEREIVVISDFQPLSGDTPVLLTAPDGIGLTQLQVAAEAVPNQAVVHLRAIPAKPVSGQPFRIEAEIHNYSDQPVRRPLSLRIGERYEQSVVNIAPQSSTVAGVDLEMAAETSLSVTAELDPDGFTVDDQRHLILPMRPALRVGVWGTDATARMWSKTLDALPGVNVVPVENPSVLPDQLDALMLSGWQGEGLDAIRKQVASNTPLFFRPDTIPPELADWLGFPAGPLAKRRMDPPIGLRIPNPWPEELSLFEDGSFGSPARGLLSQHAVYPIQDDVLRPILSLENGETVWGASVREPNVFYWNISLDKDDSDLIAQPQWVPMFGESLRYAFRHSETLQADAGDTFPLALSTFTDDALILANAQGDTYPIQNANGVYSSTEPLAPGIYRWTSADGNTLHGMRAVNLPVTESDLRPLSPETATGQALPQLDRADDWRALQEGIPLWPWLLVAAFAIAAAEQLLTQREARA